MMQIVSMPVSAKTNQEKLAEFRYTTEASIPASLLTDIRLKNGVKDGDRDTRSDIEAAIIWDNINEHRDMSREINLNDINPRPYYAGDKKIYAAIGAMTYFDYCKEFNKQNPLFPTIEQAKKQNEDIYGKTKKTDKVSYQEKLKYNQEHMDLYPEKQDETNDTAVKVADYWTMLFGHWESASLSKDIKALLNPFLSNGETENFTKMVKGNNHQGRTEPLNQNPFGTEEKAMKSHTQIDVKLKDLENKYRLQLADQRRELEQKAFSASETLTREKQRLENIIQQCENKQQEYQIENQEYQESNRNYRMENERLQEEYQRAQRNFEEFHNGNGGQSPQVNYIPPQVGNFYRIFNTHVLINDLEKAIGMYKECLREDPITESDLLKTSVNSWVLNMQHLWYIATAAYALAHQNPTVNEARELSNRMTLYQTEVDNWWLTYFGDEPADFTLQAAQQEIIVKTNLRRSKPLPVLTLTMPTD